MCDINDPNSYPTLRLESNEGSDRNLYVSARELALWGNLHLNEGSFQGNQILPKELFECVTSVMTPSSLAPTYLGLDPFGGFKIRMSQTLKLDLSFLKGLTKFSVRQVVHVLLYLNIKQWL